VNILYGIQGTGNGHVSRAIEIVPFLQQFGNVDVLVSGNQYNLELPFPVNYYCTGITFFYNRSGGIDYRSTIFDNSLFRFLRDIFFIDISRYDIVFSDFEPVTAWACKRAGKMCISLGHQASFYSRKVPRPVRKSLFGELVLRYYAPGKKQIGFHFQSYEDHIFPPVIRNAIRNIKPGKGDYYLVYLPAYGDEAITDFLQYFPYEKWKVFSKFARKYVVTGNIEIFPADADGFVSVLGNCKGLLTSAGFEGPSEALYLKKKLLVVPIQGQYEQACNAAALQEMGITVLPDLFSSRPCIAQWLEEAAEVSLETNEMWKKVLTDILLYD
jgi:uncharacterized protein (TIGR00661 family)